MTTVSTIIRDAYRESNLLAIAADPTTAEVEEGLRLLNRLVASVYGNEMGEPLRPLPIGGEGISRPSGFPFYRSAPDWSDWFLPGDARLTLNLSEPVTVYLNPVPEDGQRFAVQDEAGNLSTTSLTVSGNGRKIDGAPEKVFSTDGENSSYVYRADIGEWKVVSPLTETDDFPFPSEFDDYFVIGLAYRLNPRHATVADPQSTQAFARSRRQFQSRYRQHKTAPSERGLYDLPSSKERYYGFGDRANSLFDYGLPPFFIGGFRW